MSQDSRAKIPADCTGIISCMTKRSSPGACDYSKECLRKYGSSFGSPGRFLALPFSGVVDQAILFDNIPSAPISLMSLEGVHFLPPLMFVVAMLYVIASWEVRCTSCPIDAGLAHVTCIGQ